MKIAVSSTGQDLDAAVDPRFGRCAYFAILDLDSGGIEATANPFLDAAGGAGTQAAQWILDQEVDVLLTGHCGPKAAAVLADAGTRHGTLVHARLGIGEDNSGKLVTLVRREARRLAQAERAGLILNDGPPGIGCPATAAITGVDLVLAITEPTPAGIHDLQRVAGLCGHFSVPLVVCINKHDLDAENSSRIRGWCATHGIPVAGDIPVDPAVNRALVARRSVIEMDCGAVSTAVSALWEDLRDRLDLD